MTGILFVYMNFNKFPTS